MILQLCLSSGKLNSGMLQAILLVVLGHLAESEVYLGCEQGTKFDPGFRIAIPILDPGCETYFMLKSKKPRRRNRNAAFPEAVECMTDVFVPFICKSGTQILSCRLAGIENAASIGRKSVV